MFVGIDVAKDRLDGYYRRGRAVRAGERFAGATDPDRLAARLRQLQVQLIVLEASAGDEAPVAAAPAAAGPPVAIVNPRQVRQLAGAVDMLIGTSPLWRAKENLLKSVPGSAIVARTWLIATGLGRTDRYQIGALTGAAGRCSRQRCMP